MTEIVVRIPAALRASPGSEHELRARAGTVAEVLRELGGRHPQLVQRLLTPEGELRPFVNVFVGRANVRGMSGLATRVCRRAKSSRSCPPWRAADVNRARAPCAKSNPAKRLELALRGAVLVDVRDAQELRRARRRARSTCRAAISVAASRSSRRTAVRHCC